MKPETKKKIEKMNKLIREDKKYQLKCAIESIHEKALELYDVIAYDVYSNDEALDDELYKLFNDLMKCIKGINKEAINKIDNELYYTCDLMFNDGASLADVIEYYATGGDVDEQNTNK